MRGFVQERRESIANLVRENGFIRNSELSSRLGVSIITIRQDIEALDGQGVVKKTYGGAMFQAENDLDSAFDSRSHEHVEAKRRIGRRAAELIQPGETIFLDAGSTAFEIARRLPDNADITVVTCAANIAVEICEKPGIHVLLCGGRLSPRTLSVTGHHAEQMLAEICADRLFLGTYGVDLERGLAERSYEGAQVKRALVAAAREVVLVCDSSKFGALGPVVMSPLEIVQHVITDVGIPAEYRDWFAARQIGVDAV